MRSKVFLIVGLLSCSISFTIGQNSDNIIPLNSPCIVFNDRTPTKVIRSASELNELFKNIKKPKNCDLVNFYEIDFKKFDLIGLRLEYGGCEYPEVKVETYYTNKLNCKVTLKNRSSCRAILPFSYWFLIAKNGLNENVIIKP